MVSTQSKQKPKISPDAGGKAVISKDSGHYGSKDSMEEYVGLLQTVAARRRLWRILVLLALGASIIGIAIGASTPWDTGQTIEAYDPDVGVAVSLAGCDARFISGETATVTVEARKGMAAVSWARPSDGAAISAVQAHNTEWDCADAPLGVCSSWCRVTVSVPESAVGASFTLAQPAGDTSYPSATIGRVVVASLATIPSGSPLPSLSVHLIEPTIKGDVTLRLHEGSMHARGADIRGKVRVAITGGGSVRVHELDAREVNAPLSFAQPGGMICIASDVAATTFAHAAPWSECELAADESALAAELGARYDVNADGAVSRAEFLMVSEALACCGPSAPLSCSCTPEADLSGLSAALTASGGGLSIASFASHMYNLSSSGLVGYPHAASTPCSEGVELQVPSAGSSGRVFSGNYLELASRYGDVSVTVRQAVADTVPSVAWASVYSASGLRAVKGPKLSRTDAKRLQKRYHGLGTAASASDTLPTYIVFDVESTVGKPWRRWIYSTSDAYLAIDPAHLAMLSGSAIAPSIKKERVRIVNDDCYLLAPPAGSEATAADYSAIATKVDLATYAQLRAVLLGLGDVAADDEEVLRGSLVLVADDDEPTYSSGGESNAAASSTSSGTEQASSTTSSFSYSIISNAIFHSPRYVAFEPRAHGAPGERLRLDWSSSSAAHASTVNVLGATAILALAAGVASGLFGLYAFWVFIRRVQHDTQVTTSARARAVLARHNLPESDIRGWLSREDVSERVGSAEYASHPVAATLAAYDHVLFTLSEVCITPLRRMLISSVGWFVKQKLREAPLRKAKGAAAATKTASAASGSVDYYSSFSTRPIDMRELIQKYELFCVAHGYCIDESVDAVHDYLTARHVMVHQSFVRRIFGLKWRNPRRPLEPKGNVSEKDMPADLQWQSLYAPSGGDPEARAKKLDDEEKRKADGRAAKGSKDKAGGKFTPTAPLEYGGNPGVGAAPPIEPLKPLISIENRQSSTQYQQQRSAPPMPKCENARMGGGALPPLVAENAAAAPRSVEQPRAYMYDGNGQIRYDEYGSPIYADSVVPPATPGGPPPATPPPTPPPSPPARYNVVPPAEGSYPMYQCAAGAARTGCAIAASHAAALKASYKLPSADAGPVQPDPLPAEWWVLRRFIREFCFEEPG